MSEPALQHVTKIVREATNKHFEQWEVNNIDLDTLQRVKVDTQELRQDIIKRRHEFTTMYDKHGLLVVECQGAKWMVLASFAMQTSLALRKHLTEQLKERNMTPHLLATLPMHSQHPYTLDCLVRHWKEQSRDFDKDGDWTIRNAIELPADVSLHSIDKSNSPMQVLAELYILASVMDDQSFITMITTKLRHRILNVVYDYGELLNCLEKSYLTHNETPGTIPLKKIFLTGTIMHLAQIERSPDAPRLTKMKETAEIKDDLEEGAKYCIWKLSWQR